MKHIARISVAALTFIIGLISVWLVSEKSWPKNNPVVEPTVTVVVPAPALPPTRFTPTARGCGMGYGQAYEMPDGRTMSEGSVCFESSREARREWRELLATATKTVEHIPEYKNRFGEKGERVVALFPPDEYGEESARIMWYGGGECYLYINAPALDIALEFEKSNAYAF